MPSYLRFRRTARIAPGIRLNFSKSGVSTSFGPRGFHYTIGHGRRRTTVGIPGTGVSYTTYSHAHAAARSAAAQHVAAPVRAAAVSRESPGIAAAPSQSPGAADAPPTHPPTVVESTTSFTRMAGLLPSQKIAWGIALTLLLITAPLGLWLLVTGLWQLHVPEWRIRMYVHQAAREPANAAELLASAMAVDPHNPEALGPMAELHSARGDDAGALPLYREYCQRVPSDWLARGHFAMAALRCNQVDEAITQLDAIRTNAPLAEDSLASVVAHLAYAHLCREDPQQALALLDNAGTHPGAGAPGAQQCLFYQGVCEYMLGRTSIAIAQLDRLYAINPSYDGLRAAKDGMAAAIYELLLPDGQVLVPVKPGHITRSVVKVQRAAPRSPHCLECQAPLAPGAVQCPYCHASVAAISGDASAPPPPPASPPLLG